MGFYPSGRAGKHSPACMQGCDTATDVAGRVGSTAADDAAEYALPYHAEVCAGAGVVGCGSGPWVRLGSPRCFRSARSGLSICATPKRTRD